MCVCVRVCTCTSERNVSSATYRLCRYTYVYKQNKENARVGECACVCLCMCTSVHHVGFAPSGICRYTYDCVEERKCMRMGVCVSVCVCVYQQIPFDRRYVQVCFSVCV